MAGIRIKGRKQRIPFELEGADGRVEEFSIRGMPGWTFLEFSVMAAASGEASENETPAEQLARAREEAKQAGELLEVFEEAIGDVEMFQRFRGFMRDPANGFDMYSLQELFRELQEASAQRPTEPSKSSGPGQAKTGTGSTETLPSVG